MCTLSEHYFKSQVKMTPASFPKHCSDDMGEMIPASLLEHRFGDVRQMTLALLS
jgi:hypothetical protein